MWIYSKIQVEGEVFKLNVYDKLDKLKAENNLSNYRIAKNCGLSETTISNIFRRCSLPNLDTLETICNGFGLSLSQFFWEENENFVVLSEQQMELFNKWEGLSQEQKLLVNDFINLLYKTNK